jgi:hypothetical protein
MFILIVAAADHVEREGVYRLLSLCVSNIDKDAAGAGRIFIPSTKRCLYTA